MLIKGLPPDAAIWRNEPELGGWTRLEHLLATLIEVVDAAGYRSLVPHMKKGRKLPDPLRIPRPGVGGKPERREATAESVAALGGALIVDDGTGVANGG